MILIGTDDFEKIREQSGYTIEEKWVEMLGKEDLEKLEEKMVKILVVVHDEEYNENYHILLDDKDKSQTVTDYINCVKKSGAVLSQRHNIRYYYLQKHKDEE